MSKSKTIEAYGIRPEDRSRALKCCHCRLTYPLRDYKILFENKKLFYFKYKPLKTSNLRTFCHGCLLKAVASDYPNADEIPLKLINGEYEYSCRYYPTEIDKDDSFLDEIIT